MDGTTPDDGRLGRTTEGGICGRPVDDRMLGLRTLGRHLFVTLYDGSGVETRRSRQRRAIVSLNGLVGAGEDSVQGRRSNLRRRPVIDAAQRAAHQLVAVAIGQVCEAERIDPLCVGQQVQNGRIRN